MLTRMKQVTVRLADELDARLRAEAARREVTIAELVREAVDAHLRGRRRILAVGVRRGGAWDIAHHVDEIPSPRDTAEGLTAERAE